MISVIVTVYNGEKHIERCLNSICNQTINDFELIVVNDGSHDSSLNLIHAFEDKVEKMKVISISNSGVSHARNTGIDAASGEYLYFVDCDDWLEKDALARMLAMQDDAQLLVFSYYKDAEMVATDKPSTWMERKTAVDGLLDDPCIKGYVWNKLFLTDLVKSHQIQFDETITFCEDLKFCLEYMLCCERIKWCHMAAYHYCTNEISVTSSYYSHKKLSAIKALDDCITMLVQNGCDDQSILKYKTYHNNMVISLLMYGKQTSKITKDEQTMLQQQLRKYPMKDIQTMRIKVSTYIGRISVTLLYAMWRMIERNR